MGKLTIKQKLFCQHYLETLGNGTEAAIKAGYNVKRRNGQIDKDLAKSIASENLTKPYLRAFINSLLDNNGLNDQVVNIHLLSLINQRANLPIKIKAIDIYYKLTGQYNHPKPDNNEQSEEIKRIMDFVASILPRAGSSDIVLVKSQGGA